MAQNSHAPKQSLHEIDGGSDILNFVEHSTYTILREIWSLKGNPTFIKNKTDMQNAELPFWVNGKGRKRSITSHQSCAL